ncbi:cellulose biosynthesis protein BcsC [Gluconacetobacter tumulisoli]|uniref:Tetratricopeptide repeat protein n=1 Tax=Gluconacetobacter tumulisoli TaxID=1286189 RepID=A0A7W4K722_9PROT|nr:cellulose biosynthesis protein BcsC [Gluconacetobacter tumulisoli]MBB2201567.1 tetratricopeptide repeat protein [Gluconacetobacter tumulisoli]
MLGGLFLGGLVAGASALAQDAPALLRGGPPDGSLAAGIQQVALSPDEARRMHAESILDLVLEEGHYWIDARQPAKALDSIQRALAIQPGNGDALAMLGIIQVDGGDLDSARNTLDRLVRAGGSADQVGRLRAALRFGPVDPQGLAEARRLAGSGNMLAAMLRYRDLFHNGDPPPGLALEYYRVLGGTILGYNDARAKLSALVASSPHDLDARLTLAQILTYRDVTRPAGLAELRRLALGTAPPVIRGLAVRAWRDTLSWMPIVGASIPLYMDWLALHPDDAMIVGRLEKARATQAMIDEGNDRTEGYVLLAHGRLDAADAAFQRALAVNPQDADVLGGLGLTAQRRRQPAVARGYFRRAIAADAARAPHWRAAIRSLDEVGGDDPDIVRITRLMADGQYDAARAALARLAQQRPELALAVLMMEGGLDRRQGRVADAERIYREVLRRRPHDPDASFNLADLLFQRGQGDEARVLMARLATDRPALLPRLQAADDADRAAHARTDVERIGFLRQALDRMPGDPWRTLGLAQALYRDGRTRDARDLMAGLTQDVHAPAANLQAGIIFAMSGHDIDWAQRLIARLPPAADNADMARITRQIALYRQIRALPPNDMRSILVLADQPDPTGDRAAILVNALLDGHDVGSARWVVAHEAAITPSPRPSQRLAYAGLSLRLQSVGDTQRFLEDYDRLMQEQVMSPTADEAQAREDVAVGLAVLKTDRLVGQKLPDDAYGTIAPVVAAHPDAARAWLALGRVYRAQGKSDLALRTDQGALRMRPDSVEAMAAVALDALATNDRPLARSMAQQLTTRDPDNPLSWQVRAENDRADGHDAQQLADLRHLRDLQCRAAADAECGADALRQPDDRWPEIDIAYDPQRGAALPASYHYRPQDGQAAAVNRQIVYLRDSVSPQVDANVYVRSRLGSGGLGQLTELAIPMTGTLPFSSWLHRMSFSVTPIMLFTGDPLDAAYTARQFGTVLVNGAAASAYHHYYAQGVGLDLRYVNHWFSADVGSTPLGFPIANVVGGVEFAPHLAPGLTLRITGDRRMVTDSELSYAGMRDPGTGRVWGGVTRLSGHGALEWATPIWNLYAGGGFAYLSGTHVADNTEIEAGLGGSATVWEMDQRQRLRLGIDLTYFGYKRNAYVFTWGQGGYFSPQSYYAIMPTIEYSGHVDRWTWFLRGEAGYQNYDDAAAPYYPLDDGLQQASMAAQPNSFGKQGASGVAGTGRARVAYQVNPELRLGLEGGYTRAGSWSEASGMLLLHYVFDGQ